MLDWLFGNPHYKLASLFVAILAWLYVQSGEVYTDQIRSKVEWNFATGLVAVDRLPTQVSLRVRGTRSAIRRARNADLRVDVDITDLGPGEHSLEFAPFPVRGLPSSVEVLGRAPSGVRFRVDKLRERRVRVEPQVVGEPASGYAVDAVVLRPTVVTLRGPTSRLTALDKVQTEPIDVSGLSTSSEVDATLDLPAGIESSIGGRFVANITLMALNERRTFPSVPVYIWDAPRYKPVVPNVEVVLQGQASVLRDLHPEDVAVFAQLPARPDKSSYEATFGATKGPTLRVLTAAGEELQAASISPPVLEIVSR